MDTLVVDKTGTLTEGRPSLSGILLQPSFQEAEVLALVASIERSSEHPLADAIVKAAAARTLTLADPTAFASIAGMGVTGTVLGQEIAIGNATLFRNLSLDPTPLLVDADALRQAGHTVMLVSIDGKPAGVVGVSDPVKSSAFDAIRELKASGLRIVMVTGDNGITAKAVGERLGIEFQANVLPQGKADAVAALQRKGAIVAMAGDGVNDAPALAQADVALAMGTGTDIAIETAGITLLGGDLRGILRARNLSRATVRNIRQNLFFAFAYNAVGVPLAAGVLFPSFGLLLNPMIAAAAMSFSSVSVIANALRLRNSRL